MKLYRSLNRHSPAEGDVGLEIEVESDLHPEVHTLPPAWTIHQEPSLRVNGVEYVSAGPLPLEKIHAYVVDLNKHIMKYHPIFSNRTSVHAHVNCHDLTTEEIWTTTFYLWLIEHALFKMVAPHRKSNRFCLSLEDSDGLLSIAFNAIRNREKAFRSFTKDHTKYAGIALHNLQDIGSIEFRMHHGTCDPDIIHLWSRVCWHSVHSAAKKYGTPGKLLESVLDNWENLTKDIYPEGITIPQVEETKVRRVLCSLIPLIQQYEYTKTEKKGKIFNVEALHPLLE